MRSSRFSLLCALLLLSAGITEARNPVLYLSSDTISTRHDLNDYLRFYIDTRNETFQENPPGEDFFSKIKDADRSQINPGTVEQPVWAEYRIKNNGSESLEFLLTVDDPTIDEITLYVPDENGNFSKSLSIEGKKDSGVYFHYRKPVFLLKLPAGEERRYLMCFYTPGDGMILGLTISDTRSFILFESVIMLISGILFGAVLFTSAHFLKLARRMKERTDLWFALNLLSFSLLYSLRIGYMQFLFPGPGPLFYNAMHAVLISFSIYSGLALYRYYLEILSISKRLDFTLRMLQWLSLAYVVVSFAKPWLSIGVGIILFLTSPFLTSFWALKLWRRGSSNARTFAIGWMGVNVFYYLYLFIQLGLIPWQRYMHATLPAAVCWSVLFFPDAIIDRFRNYKAQSMFDALTGLSNRRHFDTRLASEWNICSRTRIPISLLIIDIDNFKAYNDNFGHLSGDECLKAIADSIHDGIMRVSDCAFRYGGEEFAILLSGSDGKEALHVAHSIKDVIFRSRLPRNDNHGDYVTVSIGLSTIYPRSGDSADELIKQADAAMYRAKENGRNRICVTNGDIYPRIVEDSPV